MRRDVSVTGAQLCTPPQHSLRDFQSKQKAKGGKGGGCKDTTCNGVMGPQVPCLRDCHVWAATPVQTAGRQNEALHWVNDAVGWWPAPGFFAHSTQSWYPIPFGLKQGGITSYWVLHPHSTFTFLVQLCTVSATPRTPPRGWLTELFTPLVPRN